VNSQIASDLPFTIACSHYFLAPESDGRVLLDVQKIPALQVRVALLVQRVDFARVNNNIDARFVWIIGIVLDGALNAAKTATNIGDHHVADNELSTGVRRIDFVGCFQALSFFN
jgi:hypothetical protein